jgi:hypothetical protein
MLRRIGFFLLTGVVLAACALVAPVISDVMVTPDVITPDADGNNDLARISYRVNAPARVSIYLTDQQGRRHYIRRSALRPSIPRPYEYLFNGIGEDGRLLPEGEYTWSVEALGEDGRQAIYSGTLTILSAGVPFPKIEEFTVSTNLITPNRDAIDDHVYINVFIAQPARLRVYVIGPDNFRYDVPRMEGSLYRQPTDDVLPAGRYFFDYDGGIDLGADPPPDGEYVIVAEAEDLIGQRDVLSAPLTIKDSGRPMAEIVIQPNTGQGFEWSHVGATPEVTMKLGDTLYFTTTIRNVSNTPIRTAGPFDPNDCYTMDTNRYTKGFPEEPGVWRVGVDFETNTGEDHPWRWAVGTLDDLEVVERDGFKLYYLPPGRQVVVRGCVVLNRVPVRNPFRIWGALIQEQVEIAPINSRVTPILVTLVEP